MAIPQFQDEQPILKGVEVNSKASGYDAFGKVLGELSGVAAQKTEDLAQEQSNAVFVHTVANIDQLKTDSKIKMLQHPDQASKISQAMTESTDAINQAVSVNKSDRTKLGKYAQDSMNDVRVDAARTGVHQTQLMAAYTHYANWPDQLKAYSEALIQDPENAETLKNAMMSTLRGLVSVGALTPEQAGSGIKTMGNMVDIARDHMNLYGNPNATAQDYHTTTSNILNKNPAHNINSPINENTAWMVNYYSQDRSFQGVLSDIYNRRLPNPSVFDSLQPAQREHAILSMQGVRQADGLINSGSPLPQIQGMYDELNKRGRVLNYKEQATRNSLGVYLGKVNSGEYLDAINTTPAGGAIMQNYVNRNAAIANASMTNEQKMSALLSNKNDLVSNAVSYGYGHHFTPDKIQPIPKGDIATIEAGFQNGQDPQVIINKMSEYSRENRPWIAQALKDPIQKVALNTVALSTTVKASDQLDFLAANQKGRSYADINDTQAKTNLSDPKLSGLLATDPNFKNAMDLINNQYDPYQTQTINQALVKSALNYVKYQAAKNNDLSMANKDDYIKKAAELIADSYPKISSTNYVLNGKQLGLTFPEYDVLANYVIDQANTYLREGVKESIFWSANSRNQLKMTVSPTNEIQAIDTNNKVYWHAPFSTDLLGAAKTFDIKKKSDAEKLKKQVMEFEYTGGMH